MNHTSAYTPLIPSVYPARHTLPSLTVSFASGRFFRSFRGCLLLLLLLLPPGLEAPPPTDLHQALRSQFGSCTKLASTLLPVCSNGWPTTICKNRCNPSRRCSITSSLNRFVKTFPGNGGIVTRADSRSRMSRKYSKSLYLRRTDE